MQITTLGEKTYAEFIEKTGAIKIEIQQYQRKKLMLEEKTNTREMTINGLLPPPFPAIE